MLRHSLALTLCLITALCAVRAQDTKTEHESFQEKTCRPIPAGLDAAIDPDTGTIFNGPSAVNLIYSLLNDKASASSCAPPNAGYLKRNFPDLLKSGSPDQDLIKEADFIIHVLRWGPSKPDPKDPTKPSTQKVQQQRWYLVHDGELLRPGRMFGGKRVYFLYLHLAKDPKTSYRINYDFTIAESVPANQQNLAEAASLFSTPSGGPGILTVPAPDVWGGFQLDMWYGTSDISITASKRDESKGELGDPQPLDNAINIHNEPPNWWDVSAGIPIRKMSQLSFNGTSNALEPQQVDKKAIYGLFNLYLFPWQRRDLVYSNFTWWPSVVFGVPASKQPLHKPLIGLGLGPRFVQFYIGAVIQKQPELPAGSTLAAGASKPCTGWCPQLAFGINLPIKALQSKLKAQPANAGTSGTSKEGVGTDTKNQTK